MWYILHTPLVLLLCFSLQKKKGRRLTRPEALLEGSRNRNGLERAFSGMFSSSCTPLVTAPPKWQILQNLQLVRVASHGPKTKSPKAVESRGESCPLKSRHVRPQQGTEICNSGVPSPLEFSPQDFFLFIQVHCAI